MINSRINNAKGFTLIELLIAMAIGIMLMATATYTYTKQSDVIRKGNQETQTRGMARLALDELVTEIRRAGYGMPPGDSGAGRLAQGITNATATSITYRANTDNVWTTVSVDCGDLRWYLFVADNTGFAVKDALSIFSLKDMTMAETETITLVTNYNGTSTGICSTTGATINSDYLLWGPTLTNLYTPIDDNSAVVIHKYHTITYTYNSGPMTITVADDNGTNVDTTDDTTTTVAGNVTGVTFTYYDASGTALTTLPLNLADRGNVRRINISVTVQDRIETTVTETFDTDVTLRNMGT